MKKISAVLVIVFSSIIQTLACSCAEIDVSQEVDRAYDVVIGKVTSEKEGWVFCKYPYGNKEYESATSILYTVQTEFSYKGQISGVQTILGGKGKGDCGGIFQVGKEYLIVVYKCDKGLYTFMCSDHANLKDASNQVNYLNKFYGKNYKILKVSALTPYILVSLLFSLAAGLVVFSFYRKRWTRKSLV